MTPACYTRLWYTRWCDVSTKHCHWSTLSLVNTVSDQHSSSLEHVWKANTLRTWWNTNKSTQRYIWRSCAKHKSSPITWKTVNGKDGLQNNNNRLLCLKNVAVIIRMQTASFLLEYKPGLQAPSTEQVLKERFSICFYLKCLCFMLKWTVTLLKK